ncbi:hypothetical protein, conserved [Babesia ovata]|uniref:6-Cys domain-containing protein n=1 Tax=Babesia ovata TaxID=189622 RepID=A0A2H6K7D0_9APIC|nr:uncharacterized protein BOVATA_003520 [Babesia ovata]GBE58859.1 hypothetical protein, conserved [Babesia ovata]
MAKFSSRAALAFCAVALCSIVRLVAASCNFEYPPGLLSSNALVACHENLEVAYSAYAICPRQVNGTEYVWHPQPTSDDNGEIKTYVSENERLRSVSISDVIRTEGENPFITLESNVFRTDIRFKKPMFEMIALTEKRLIFICGPKDLVLNDELQRHLGRLDGFGKMQQLPWTTTTPLAAEIAKIGNGLGVFYLNRGRMDLPLQGCGSRPSPLFAADNEVAVDPITGVRSCVADPMSLSPIGFLCEGRIEPDGCMRSLINQNDEVVTAPTPYSYRDFDNRGPWVIARYFNGLALPPINGECRCVDSATGRVKARMEIRTKTDYVCDISRKALPEPFSRISGPWCSVVLHPGSTLTIRLPTQHVNSVSIGMASADDTDKVLDMDVDEYESTVAFSQPPAVYEYETELLPKDLTTLRHLASVYDFDIHNEALYHEALAGDALEMDVSQIARGEVKLTYHLDKPLAQRHATNAFDYHWALISKEEEVQEKIRGTVDLTIAFTHEYDIIGCDRGTPSVFDPNVSKAHCSVKSMANGIGDIYECKAHIKEELRQAGIYCRPDEELLPHNCESMGYDLHKNRMISIPGSVRNATPYPIQGFQLFDYFFRNNSPLSYACFCVDERGYERSRLVVESHHDEEFTSIINREKASHTLLPHILLPWHEVELSSGGLTSPESLLLNNISQESVNLRVGKTLSMTCGIALARPSECDSSDTTIDEDFPATWLPTQPEEFYYSVNETPDAIELIKVTYNDSLATTPGGFNVEYPSDKNGTKNNRLVVQSTMGAILISKNPIHKQFVPMTFVCGKTPETSDLSVITGNASTSDAPAQPLPNVMGLSMGYTWNAVEVKVETTDPYMQGCGVAYSSVELFKPETPKLYDADGQQIGCKIDLHATRKAAFYCPAPYVLDPPNCFSQVYVDGEVKNVSDFSKSLVASRSNHFVNLRFNRLRVRPEETLRQTPPLECRCVTVKGAVLSTIQIENYYSK